MNAVRSSGAPSNLFCPGALDRELSEAFIESLTEFIEIIGGRIVMVVVSLGIGLHCGKLPKCFGENREHPGIPFGVGHGARPRREARLDLGCLKLGRTPEPRGKG
jgi:hypothetical protein